MTMPITVNTYLYGLVTYQFVVYHNTSMSGIHYLFCCPQTQSTNLLEFNDPLWMRSADTNNPVLQLIYFAMQSSCWNSFRHGYLA